MEKIGLEEMYALTGVTKIQLKKLKKAAQKLAKKYHSSIEKQIEIMSMIFARLGTGLVNQPNSIAKLIDNCHEYKQSANIDIRKAVNNLITSILSYHVNINDGNEVSYYSKKLAHVLIMHDSLK